MTAKGMLIVTANPPVHMEEEFNAWYDLEHLAERLAVPGFESGRRLVRLDMERRYLALYDLAEIGVLDTPEYLAVSGDRATAWTKRIVAACRFRRFAATEVSPPAPRHRSGPNVMMLMLDDCDLATANRYAEAHFAGKSGVVQARVFAAVGTDRPKHFIIVEGVVRFTDGPAAAADTSEVIPSEIGLYAPY